MKSVLGGHYDRMSKYHDYIRGEREQARQAILSIIDGAESKDVACLCGESDAFSVLATIDRWGLPSRNVICSACGLVRVSPRWDDKTYETIYKNHFWPLQTGHKVVSDERYKLSVERSKACADYLMQQFAMNGKKVIEIGCSYGAALVRLKAAGGDLTGYDWDENILALGRRQGQLDLRFGGVDAALRDFEGKADVVILRHVFEHLLDPFAEAEKLKRLLAPNGQLYVEVPGLLNEVEHGKDPVSFYNAFHTYGFTLTTLMQVLEKVGFSLVSGDEQIRSVWKIAETGQQKPSATPDGKHAEKVLNYLKRLEEKRKAGRSLLQRLIEAFRGL